MDKKLLSTKKIVLKTALATFFTIIFVAVILMIVVFLCFPYQAYKFAMSMGLHDMALDCAERYADKGNIDGFVYCVELDDRLLKEKGENKYALKLIEHTEKFFEYDDVDEFIARLDNYYIENSPVQSRISVFSYNEYIVSKNFSARTFVKDNDKMLFRGKPTAIKDLFSNDLNLIEEATIFSALHKSMTGANEFTPFTDKNGNVTAFFMDLTSRVPLYVEKLNLERKDKISTKNEQLETLFLIRSVVNLISSTKEYFKDNEYSLPKQWQEFSSLRFGDKTLSKAYSELYLNYVKT